MAVPASKTDYGRRIEIEAAKWFQVENPRARLLNSNYRCKAGEIDLIFLLETVRRSELVFVEVRARTDVSWQSGVESVDSKKRRKLHLAIRHFLAGYRGKASAVRLDILAWDGSGWSHVPNCWE